MGKAKNIETFLGLDSDYETASAVVFGAPYDSTTSFRPGARFAGRAMRSESWGLESYSPYQDRDLSDISVFDGGDLELPFGGPEPALEAIEGYVSDILEDGKRPCMIGGEHLVTLGAVRAMWKRYPGLHILHFDAHADLRDSYLGQALSHATVLRRCWELVGDGHIHQFGIRSGEREEFRWGAEHVHTRKFDLAGLADTAPALAGKPLYLTLDLDILDPSVFPGTGTPEPGGVGFLPLLEGLLSLSGLRIVGFDLCELSPHYDQTGASTAVACKLLREMLLAFLSKELPGN